MEQGILKKGAEVEIVGVREAPIRTTVTGIEMFRKELDQAMAGDNLGLLLRGTKREDVSRGMVVAIPGTVKPARKFLASFYILSKDEGGRSKGFGQLYRPQVYSRTCGMLNPSPVFVLYFWFESLLMIDMTVTLTFPEGVDKDHMVMPGDNCELVCELIHPIALDKGSRFTIRMALANNFTDC